jgi:SNF2 family DNA or RNA helicase
MVRMTEFQTEVYDNILTGHVRRKEKMKLKAALAVAEEDLFKGTSKGKKKGKEKCGTLVSSDRFIDDEEAASVAVMVTPGEGVCGKGPKVESDVEKVVRELSNSEAAHLFTALRKAANHPLLLRVRYQDEEVMREIAGIAYSRGRFGNQCDYQRVRDEIDSFSDFDLHQLCLEYPETLGHLQLEADVLYDSQKMQKLKAMLPKLVVRAKEELQASCSLIAYSSLPLVFSPLVFLTKKSIISFYYIFIDSPPTLCQTHLPLRLLITYRFPYSTSPCFPYKADGHRILVFSQWTRLLDLLEVLLNDIDLHFLRLDGSTPVKVTPSSPCLSHQVTDLSSISYPLFCASRSLQERQELIDNFSSEGSSIPIFLLSTKAGGLGINLTAADTVIMHDLDFNPENDRQAEVVVRIIHVLITIAAACTSQRNSLELASLPLSLAHRIV